MFASTVYRCISRKRGKYYEEHQQRIRRSPSLSSRLASGGAGYPSESAVKKGKRVVHGDKELQEKLGRQDLCPCGSGKRFKKCCRNSGRYDGSLRKYYF